MEHSRDRWLRVKQLFADAVARPPAERARFLADACGDDAALGREVGSLLAGHDEAGDFFERRAPAVGALAGAGVPLPGTVHLSPERRLGPYEIVALLGAGGMGEVYRARDTRLHRDVALKILPPALVADPTRRARFVQEARAASALEHPHIAVIHEIGDADGVTFIAMELVRGEALGDVLARGPLTPSRALDVAVEIAEGLARAHEIGIVHRDLKPANVMLTEQGHAKIIDFGLAKLVTALSGDSDGITFAGHVTESGVVLGTASYMSPEQARGDRVDHRSDVFSFGIVLYEMLTGRPPFRGTSSVDTLHAILHEPVPPLPPSIGLATDDLQRILDKCLAKEPRDRYQGMRDLVVDLRAARRRLDSASISGIGAVASTRRRRWAYGAIALGVIALAAAGTFVSLRVGRRAPADRSQWVQVTNLDYATDPALSPDGRMLAFIRGSGTFTTEGQLYLKPLPDGEPVPITRDTLTKMSPAFSPDGARIAYTVIGDQGFNTWIVPALRGEPRLWLRNAYGLTWAGHDHLLFSEVKRSHRAIVASTESRAESRDVYLPADELELALRSFQSPDEKSVLIVGSTNGRYLPCRLVPFGGGSLGRLVGPSNASCTSAGWSSDGAWMYFSANNGDGFHLWRQRFPDGQPEQITSGPTEEEGVAVAADGRSVITSVGLQQRSVSIHDARGERQVSVEGYAFWPLVSADGTKVCYRVTRTAATGQSPSELWITDIASGRTDRLLAGQLITGFDLSSDDRIVAAVPEADGKSRLWIAWLDGREPPRRIAGADGDNPRFLADGEVVFRAQEEHAYALIRIREDGTRRERIATANSQVFGNASPDGRFLSSFNVEGLVLQSTRGEAPVKVFPPGQTSRMRWSRDGSRLYMSLQIGRSSGFGVGRTYVIPLSRGEVLPHIPAGGFRTEAELAAIPGVQILPHSDVGPGSTPDVYTFSRTTITRNLYRIPLP